MLPLLDSQTEARRSTAAKNTRYGSSLRQSPGQQKSRMNTGFQSTRQAAMTSSKFKRPETRMVETSRNGFLSIPTQPTSRRHNHRYTSDENSIDTGTQQPSDYQISISMDKPLTYKQFHDFEMRHR